MYEISVKIGKKLENVVGNPGSKIIVEVTTPWSWDGRKGNNMRHAYQEKVKKYGAWMALLEQKKPEYRVEQAMIVVSPTGAIPKETMEEFAKITRLTRGKLAFHYRSMVQTLWASYSPREGNQVKDRSRN